MILYHVPTAIVKQPQIITKEIGRDFGPAFYTTDIREQASRWAKRKARLSSKQTRNSVDSYISVYEWERNSSLNILEFNDASMQWLDMVLQCRSNPDYQHDEKSLQYLKFIESIKV